MLIRARYRRATGALLVGALTMAGASLAAPSASADTAPPSPSTPTTVSADPLPTVQIDGVVWSQVTVGNTVYAAGKFTTARPAGAAPGTSTVPRNNLLAYDITTGQLNTAFNPGLNAQGRVLTLSPDGTKLYVGGDFTTAGGVHHGGIAEFNTATGQLVSTFAPSLTGGPVKALTATNTTVYAGGTFTSANGVARSELAAFDATSGALLPWAPSAANGGVGAMVLTPDASRVIVGGQFSVLNGQTVLGLGALDASTGLVLPWAANQSIRNYGTASNASGGIYSLHTDGTLVYGTGWTYGSGNFEGEFAADPDTGVIKAMEDCRGDTYDSFATGGVVYTVSHAHYCGSVGGFPDGPAEGKWHRSLAFTQAATQTITHPNPSYPSFAGYPGQTLLHWFPWLTAGTYTGQNQAAWSVTGNANYLSLGGEFPTVGDNVAQQGLVRYAIRPLAPNKVGPKSVPTPTATSPSRGSVQLSWTSAYDLDNQQLTYKVVRDGNTGAPITTFTGLSNFWNRPTLTYTDNGLVSGSSHTYKLYVVDPLGNSVPGGTVTVSVG